MDKQMNNYLYTVFKSKHTIDDITYTSFGIVITSTQDNSVIERIADISTSKEKIKKLVNLCNELSLEPIHIYDVIEDFIL